MFTETSHGPFLKPTDAVILTGKLLSKDIHVHVGEEKWVRPKHDYK